MTLRTLTPKEVAKALQITRPQVYRLIGDHKLPALRVGGQWRITEDALREYMGLPEPPQEVDFSASVTGTDYHEVTQ